MNPNELARASQLLLDDCLSWLRDTYPSHGFVVERDLVRTLQRWLVEEVPARGLPLRVLNDCGVEPGARRSYSADLAPPVREPSARVRR